MKRKLLPVLAMLSATLSMAQEGQRVYGTISDGYDNLANIKVEIEGSVNSAVNSEAISAENFTFSNADGFYEITASPRDILMFTGSSVDTLRVIVEDVTSRLNITMQLKVEELDEVVVADRRISSQRQWAAEYYTNPRIVNTVFGYRNGGESSFHMYTLDENEIGKSADFLNMMVTHIPGAKIRYANGERYLDYQGGPPMYDVDGVIRGIPFWLKPSDIKRVAIIPGDNAKYQYGPAAAFGVVVVNTKTGFHGTRDSATGKPVDQVRLRNNFASSYFLDHKDALENASRYWMELETSEELADALEVINKYETSYSHDANFFLQAYETVFGRWGAEPADAMITKHKAIFKDHPVNLKSLAYLFEAQGRKSEARELYKEIFLLRPDYAQSYMDLAGGYYGMNEFEKSASLLMRYIDFTNRLDSETDPEGAESSEFELLMRNEVVSASAIMPGKGPKVESEIGGTRLVFAWTDAEAEFDLQFINPGNQYHKWNHSQESDADRIYQEKLLGYSSQEFFLDGSLPGQWEVRCTYKGNKKRSPSYLKMIVYRNFGMPNQTREVQTFRLQLNGVSVRLAGIYVPPSGVGR